MKMIVLRQSRSGGELEELTGGYVWLEGETSPLRPELAASVPQVSPVSPISASRNAVQHKACAPAFWQQRSTIHTTHRTCSELQCTVTGLGYLASPQ